jgi:sugar phosphate isomerase/epimerase
MEAPSAHEHGTTRNYGGRAPFRVSAMDIWFYHSTGTYSFDDRCEMVADLGFDGLYITLWNDQAWQDVPRIDDVEERSGLSVPAIFTYLRDPGDEPNLRRIEDLIRKVKPSTHIELALLSCGATVPPSDPRGDGAVLDMFESLARLAEAQNVELSLYPHSGWWLQTTDDAVRLCAQLDQRSLRLAFSAFHWYAADGLRLPQRLKAAAPFLNSVNLSGAHRLGTDLWASPIDEGELDTFHVLREVAGIGYDGFIHLFGYGIGGDVYSKLGRSLNALRDIERRISSQPGWGDLGPIADASLLPPRTPR